MNIIIIEDESLALKKIKRLFNALDMDFSIIAEIKSVEQGLHFSEKDLFKQADLIFSDIQLSDGLSFQIFEKYPTHTPIIFTTAYDEYALKAFQVSGIDYLLKPFQKEDLESAIKKYQNFKSKLSNHQSSILQLLDQFQQSNHVFPNFISYFKDKIIPINSQKVSCFFIENQVVFAIYGTQKSPLNDTLDKIEKRLPEHHFFRANRQHIISRESIKSIEHFFNGKLKVQLNTAFISSVTISKEKSSLFKRWLEL